MERNKKRDNGWLYTVICCFAVALAVIGFASTKTKKNESENEIPGIIPNAQIAEKTPEKKEMPEVLPDEVVNTEPVSKETQVEEEITFSRPVQGKVISEYSDEELLYYEALKDWRTHNGIDIETDSGEQVKAAANGVVSSVYDSNMGRSVVLEHQNGYLTVYSNLAEDTALKEGDEVSEGDVIGKIGNTALGDVTEAPHLHFEIIKNGKNENPTDYLE